MKQVLLTGVDSLAGFRFLQLEVSSSFRLLSGDSGFLRESRFPPVLLSEIRFSFRLSPKIFSFSGGIHGPVQGTTEPGPKLDLGGGFQDPVSEG